MSDSRTWTRPRFLLALLLAALVAGAVPIRLPASRGDKSSAAAWRAASARPVSPRPDGDHAGFPPLPAFAPELLPLATLIRSEAPRVAGAALPAPAPARSPLPRAPPLA